MEAACCSCSDSHLMTGLKYSRLSRCYFTPTGVALLPRHSSKHHLHPRHAACFRPIHFHRRLSTHRPSFPPAVSQRPSGMAGVRRRHAHGWRLQRGGRTVSPRRCALSPCRGDEGSGTGPAGIRPGRPRRYPPQRTPAALNRPQCPVFSSRCFYPHADHAQRGGLADLLFTPMLLQPYGDGGPDGASCDLRGAVHRRDGQFIHAAKPRH